MLAGGLVSALELKKVFAVDYFPDISCVHVEIDAAVFFLLVEVSIKLPLLDGRLSFRMF